MNKLLAIKAAQNKAAEDAGEESPYKLAARAKPGSNKPVSQLLKVKQRQLDDDKKEGVESRYLLHVDPAAPGADVTVKGMLTGDRVALFEQLQAAMEVDRGRIKTAKKLKEKSRIKVELLPAYLPFVDDYVLNGHDYACDICVWVMIWQFDIGEIDSAFALGMHLVAIGNQVMPKQFGRDLPTFIADEVYDWSNEQLKNGHTASPYLDELVSTVKVDGWDLHPAVHSKNLVMLAKHHMREENYAQCYALCVEAEEVNPTGAGVKSLKTKAAAMVKAKPEKVQDQDQDKEPELEPEPPKSPEPEPEPDPEPEPEPQADGDDSDKQTTEH